MSPTYKEKMMYIMSVKAANLHYAKICLMDQIKIIKAGRETSMWIHYI